MDQKCRLSILTVLISTLILGIVTSLSHMAYHWSNESLIVGFFNPVNESVWEHLKFMFFPNLLWWILIYLFCRDKCNINLHSWIIASATSLIIAPLMVLFLYYSYTGVTGAESLIADIAISFISYFIALWLGLHVYKYVKPNSLKVILSILIIIIIFVTFIIFTLKPPHLPLFYDASSDAYGIFLMAE